MMLETEEQGTCRAVVLRCVAAACQRDENTISTSSRLVQELGLDSIRLLELQADLETALAIDDLPLQDWLDQAQEEGLALTVDRLVSACEQILMRRGEFTLLLRGAR